MYGSSEQSDIYSHNMDSEDTDRKKFTTKASINTLKRINHSDLMEKETKNININFSINNFSYLKETDSEARKYISPESFDLRKKKSVKRIKTQGNADNMNSILSPSKLGISKSKATKREEKKTPTKSHLKTSKTQKNV